MRPCAGETAANPLFALTRNDEPLNTCLVHCVPLKCQRNGRPWLASTANTSSLWSSHETAASTQGWRPVLSGSGGPAGSGWPPWNEYWTIPDVVTAKTWNRLPNEAATARPLPPPGSRPGCRTSPASTSGPDRASSSARDVCWSRSRTRARTHRRTRSRTGTTTGAGSWEPRSSSQQRRRSRQTPPPLALHRFITPPAAIANTCDLLPNIAVTG